jgi:hypothetical protein
LVFSSLHHGPMSPCPSPALFCSAQSSSSSAVMVRSSPAAWPNSNPDNCPTDRPRCVCVRAAVRLCGQVSTCSSPARRPKSTTRAATTASWRRTTTRAPSSIRPSSTLPGQWHAISAVSMRTQSPSNHSHAANVAHDTRHTTHAHTRHTRHTTPWQQTEITYTSMGGETCEKVMRPSCYTTNGGAAMTELARTRTIRQTTTQRHDDMTTRH